MKAGDDHKPSQAQQAGTDRHGRLVIARQLYIMCPAFWGLGFSNVDLNFGALFGVDSHLKIWQLLSWSRYLWKHNQEIMTAHSTLNRATYIRTIHFNIFLPAPAL